MNPTDTLPPSVLADADSTGSGPNANNTSPGNSSASSHSLSSGAIGGIVAAVVAALAIFGTILGFFILRRRRTVAQGHSSGTLLSHETGAGGANAFRQRDSDSASFAPLQRSDMVQWGQSRDNLVSPSPDVGGTSSGEFDPYGPRISHDIGAVGPTRYR